MVHLIGLDHSAQARETRREMTPDQSIFARCLRQTIAEVRPALVAEEYSEECLEIYDQVSIAEEIANDLDVEHRFCDPNKAQRRAIGYKDWHAIECALLASNPDQLSDEEIALRSRALEIACYFPIREAFWLSKLGSDCHKPLVFVCGEEHIESFGALLARAGLPSQIVERGIGVKARDNLYRDARQYLSNHPEIALLCSSRGARSPW